MEYVQLFVYGTLKKDYPNHPLMDGSEFLGIHVTDPEYTMFHLRGYPGVIRKGDTSIVGEVWKVPTSILDRLDRFEGHPYLFARTKLKETFRGKPLYAYIYQHNEEVNYTVIDEGEWTYGKKAS